MRSRFLVILLFRSAIIAFSVGVALCAWRRPTALLHGGWGSSMSLGIFVRILAKASVFLGMRVYRSEGVGWALAGRCSHAPRKVVADRVMPPICTAANTVRSGACRNILLQSKERQCAGYQAEMCGSSICGTQGSVLYNKSSPLH